MSDTPLADVVLAVDRIQKDTRNEFAKYDYASKDAVYHALRGPLADQGLVPWLSGVEVEYREQGDKLWMSVTFEAAVTPNGAAPEKAERITVPIQVTGPQSAQAIRSYAMKYYLATKFMVPIDDGEDVDQAPRQSVPRPDPKRVEAENAYRELKTLIENASSKEGAIAVLAASSSLVDKIPAKGLDALNAMIEAKDEA